MATIGLLDAADWVGFHVDDSLYNSGAGRPPDVETNGYQRLDVFLSMLTNWGKPLVMDEWGVECHTNRYLIDRSDKELIMMRSYGVKFITPGVWFNNGACIADGTVDPGHRCNPSVAQGGAGTMIR